MKRQLVQLTAQPSELFLMTVLYLYGGARQYTFSKMIDNLEF